MKNYHRNVLQEGFGCPEFDAGKPTAVFLDLPKPEIAVAHAASVLAKGGRICSFSPALEQVQATAKAMAANGFLRVETVELLERQLQTKFQKGEEDGQTSNIFVQGVRMDKTHTGFLTFGTKYTD